MNISLSGHRHPLRLKYKPELYPHGFISLSKDGTLAEGAGGITGGLCRAKLVGSARVLDLRDKSDDALAHWQCVLGTEFGRDHALIQSFDSWVQSCTNGEVLRLHTTNQELGAKLAQLQTIAQATSSSLQHKVKAFLDVQNFTRLWIDSVITPAIRLGYEAVICAEIDSYRSTGPKACLNLYVFEPRALSAPEWLSVPDEALMVSELRRMKDLGFA